MAEKNPEQETTTVCPLCQGAAERGTLYAPDRTGALQWYPGPPSWKKNLASALILSGKIIGKVRGNAGVYLEGIRCRSCKRLILEE